jgi:ABC-type transporter Mla subunit MlaD
MATTTNTSQQVKDKAKDAANTAIDKASDFAQRAGEKAGDLAHQAGERADTAASSVGTGMKNLAGTVREHTPQGGMLGAASERVAEGLEAGGKYLEDKGLSGVGEDFAGLIRRNPIPAVLIGIGLGFLIASATSRR